MAEKGIVMADDKDRPIWPSPEAPLAVAHKIYDDYRHAEVRTLVCWRDNWMSWDVTHWAEISISELRSHVYKILHDVAYKHPIRSCGEIVGYETREWNPNKRKISDV